MTSILGVIAKAVALVLFFGGTALSHGTRDKELISPADLASAGELYRVLDIRSVDDFGAGHVPGAILLPISELSDNRLKALGLSDDMPLIVYGLSEAPAKKAKMLLDILGYSQVRILAGGYTHWVEDGQAIEKGGPPPSTAAALINSAPGLKLEPERFDFGTISQKNGVVHTVFTVKNLSDKDIGITEITTSCGCTTAEMDEKSIPAGKQRSLTVYFDPNFHKEPEGKFSRTVFLQTSDEKEILATIEVEIAEQ